jgi:ribonuclease P protein component
MKKQGFPRQIRIKKESEFNLIIRGAKRTGGPNLILFRLVGDEGSGQRLGIKVAGGVKPAVRRNAVKRAIREVLRKNRHRFGDHESVVVVCKREAGERQPTQLGEELRSLIDRSSLRGSQL